MLVFSFKRNIFLEVEEVNFTKKVFRPVGYKKWYHYGTFEFSNLFKRGEIR